MTGREMTETERQDFIDAWMDYAKKAKADKRWPETEEAKTEYERLINWAFEIAGV